MNIKSFATMLVAASFVAACSKEPEVVETTQPETVETEVVEPQAPAPETTVEPEIVYEAIKDLSQGGLENFAGSTVLFAYDSSELSGDSRNVLEKQAEWMAENKLSLSIEGHADERGTREYNLALGERRAVAVKNYLIALGVSADRLETISYGKERPRAVGNNEAAWRLNRRSETRVRY